MSPARAPARRARVVPPIEPMLSRAAASIPEGDFQYEPKWDGFRALVFRDGASLEIRSRNDRPLGRYFPELVEGLAGTLPQRIVLDGEIVIARERGLDFEALQMRLHPAASRIARLAAETPAHFVAFDLLALGGEDLRPRPQRERRARLEEALAGARPPLHLSPVSLDPAEARRWFERFEGAGFDGVIAKPRDLPYRAGERVMWKVKHRRTADCVVAGTRPGRTGEGPASLLLGLYDDAGRLHAVGVATGFSRSERRELEAKLAPLRRGAGRGHPWLGEDVAGDVRVPGEPSRWTGARDLAWDPLRPELVAEVAYDHLQGDRFRHATRFLRWRPDRTPRSCRYAQLETAAPAELTALFGPRPGRAAARARPRAGGSARRRTR